MRMLDMGLHTAYPPELYGWGGISSSELDGW